MIIEGRVLKYGEGINTDLIFPGKYMTLTKPEDLAGCAMVGVDPEFHKKIKSYSILVTGRNFGCGSSREHAPLALKYAGVRCILSESFARIFYRNALNIGLPILECHGINGGVEEGDTLKVELHHGVVENKTNGKVFRSKPLPGFLIKMIEQGGLIEYINAESK